MKSVRVHAVLLAAALLTAFVTWTRDDAPAPDDLTTAVWEHRPDELAAVSFQTGPRSLELQRRNAGSQTYIWARETTPEAVATPATPPADTTAHGAHTPAAADTTKPATPAAPARMRTEEFPTGQAGTNLFESLATLRVPRDLGAADAQKRSQFGLDKPESKLTIRFRNRGERVLNIGNKVVGAADRYALDSTANRIYVLSFDLMRRLEPGTGELRLTEFHGFDRNRLASVSVQAISGQLRMDRQPGPSPQGNFLRPGASEPNAGYTNFMEQVGQLWIARFAPEVSPDSLERVLRIEYFDDDGDSLSSLELFRTRGAKEERVYYMRTPRTVVPGEIYAPLGERIEQDVATLLRPGSPSTRG